MAGKFELKVAKNGKYHFNLLAGNGQIILSSEMYESKSAAENGIASVSKNAADDGRYDRLTSKGGDPYFTLKAGNGQVIGKSEMYKSTASMENGIESVKKNGPDAPTVEG
ncbi:YegP family protein [soil metagenome]